MFFRAAIVSILLLSCSLPSVAQDSAAPCYDTNVTDFKKLIAACTVAIEERKETGEKLALALKTRSWAYYSEEDFAKALADGNEALKIKPTDVWLLSNVCATKNGLGQFKAAIEQCNKAIAVDSSDPGGWESRGNALRALGETERAIKDFDRAISLDLNRIGPYIGRGQLYTDQQQYSKAISDFNKVIGLNSQKYEGFHGRGSVYYYMASYDGAIADYTAAIQRARTAAALYRSFLSRAQAYFMKSDYGSAIKDYTAALNYKPDDIDTCHRRNEAYKAVGQQPLTCDETSEIRLSKTGLKVVACMKDRKGSITIKEMRECSGVWVTPRALIYCVAGAHCPTLSDTIQGRAILNAHLKDQGLVLDSKLLLSANALPALPSAQAITGCKSSTDQAAYKQCVLMILSADERFKHAACFSEPKNLQPECLANAVPDRNMKKIVQGAATAYRCASGGEDGAAMVANCVGDFAGLDDKTRRTLICAASAGSDQAKLASCAAGQVLSEDAARLVGCASNSQGATSFALCAAGPIMNEEWRIAAECAVQTGGNRMPLQLVQRHNSRSVS
jgi:tetratricopeptide (TPR) repeat protein